MYDPLVGLLDDEGGRLCVELHRDHSSSFACPSLVAFTSSRLFAIIEEPAVARLIDLDIFNLALPKVMFDGCYLIK